MSQFPFRPPEKLSVQGLQSEIANVIGRWWHCGVSIGPLDGQDWAPPVELRDEPHCYHVLVELPGIKRDTLEVTARGASLEICGEKLQPTVPPPAEEEETSAIKVLQTERRYGGFRRTIELPGPIRTDAMTALLTDGVLEVTLPKTTGSAPEGVPIEIQAPDGPTQVSG